MGHKIGFFFLALSVGFLIASCSTDRLNAADNLRLSGLWVESGDPRVSQNPGELVEGYATSEFSWGISSTGPLDLRIDTADKKGPTIATDNFFASIVGVKRIRDDLVLEWSRPDFSDPGSRTGFLRVYFNHPHEIQVEPVDSGGFPNFEDRANAFHGMGSTKWVRIDGPGMNGKPSTPPAR